jgi:hypothetical protein
MVLACVAKGAAMSTKKAKSFTCIESLLINFAGAKLRLVFKRQE